MSSYKTDKFQRELAGEKLVVNPITFPLFRLMLYSYTLMSTFLPDFQDSKMSKIVTESNGHQNMRKWLSWHAKPPKVL